MRLIIWAVRRKSKKVITKKAKGITIISAAEIIWGFLMFIISLWLILDSYFNLNPNDKRGLGIVLGLLGTPIGLVILVTGWLTYKLKPLGRLLNLFFFSLAILGAFLTRELVLFTFPYVVFPVEMILTSLFALPYSVTKYVVIAIFLLLIIYFTRAKVKDQFKKNQNSMGTALN